MELKNKIAVVTGSSKGIGRAIAKKLAQDDYVVYVTYKTGEKDGEKVVKEIKNNGGKAHLLKLDVCLEKDVKKAFEQVKKDYGYLNVLVNNAGIEISKKIEDITLKEWKMVIDTKIDGNFLCTKYALPLLKEKDNANLIIIVSSLGDRPDYKFPAYCVGTAGTIAFMKMMAQELGQYGIRTNAVAPGTTKTPMWDGLGGDDKKMWNIFAKSNPMGRVSTPEDIANAVLMIINDKSKYLNGNIIYVNGGGHLK